VRVVLFQPEIPQNTGNIIRTCSVTGSELVLVRPLGFSLHDRWLKRAKLDYEGVTVTLIDDLEAYLQASQVPFYFLSSRAKVLYTEAPFTPDCSLIFGSETSGLDPRFQARWPEHFLTIPMKPGARCLNLATSVGIVLYEGLRQQQGTYSLNNRQ
jgi:tRNA (cytidine/uridine-2'-O-)-methyltransferase